MPLKDDWVSGEQWTADDANDVAGAVNAAYVKPGDGIPKADLVSAVQVSLGKADTAVQAVDAATISDSTSTGRAVLKAADAAAARTAIGVAYGTTSGTVVQGNDSRLSPNAAAITDSTAVGRSVLTATDAASARYAIGVSYGTTAGTVVQGNDSRIVGALKRSIQTVTESATLGSAAGTDYVVNVTAKATVTFPTAVGNTNLYLVKNNVFSNDALTFLSFNEAAGSTTGPFVNNGSGPDWVYNSPTNKPFTTDSQSKFGGRSLTGGSANDFAGNYIKPSSAHTALGTGDFTVEFWMRANSFGGDEQQFNFGLMRIHTQGGVIKYSYNNSAVITGSSLSANTWYHIALVRLAGVTKLYLNGTQTGSSYSDSNNYTDTTPMLGNYTRGFFDEFKIFSTAKYSSNFTAPTSVSDDVTLATTSSQTIDGDSSLTLSPGESCQVVSGGTNWIRF